MEMAAQSAFCRAGPILENMYLAEQVGSEGGQRRSSRRLQHARAGPQNTTGSVLFYDSFGVCTSPGDWGGFPHLNLLSASPGFFSIRDQGICGDSFLVYDNGVLLGATSDPGCVTQAECQASCEYSRGCFYLEPGVTHNIEVFMQRSLFPEVGFVGVFVGYYAQAPGADCSQSDLTGPVLDFFMNPLPIWNQSCVLEPAFAGTVPCAPGGPYPTPVLCPSFQTE